MSLYQSCCSSISTFGTSSLLGRRSILGGYSLILLNPPLHVGLDGLGLSFVLLPLSWYVYSSIFRIYSTTIWLQPCPTVSSVPLGVGRKHGCMFGSKFIASYCHLTVIHFIMAVSPLKCNVFSITFEISVICSFFSLEVHFTFTLLLCLSTHQVKNY